MEPTADPRWDNFTGGITAGGLVLPMTFGTLKALASEWERVAPWSEWDTGAPSLLRTARSLFIHAWFDYEFLAVACLIGFQATEAAFRELYPTMNRRAFKALVDRACAEEILPQNIAEVAYAGVRLRNLMSHPLSQSGYTPGMAAGMLENQHRLVALVTATAQRD